MTLYIIGNGFDLHLNLTTSYSDFARYLKSKNYKLYESLIRYFHLTANWSNFEESFSSFQIKHALNAIDEYLPEENNERSGNEWNYYDQAEELINNLLRNIQNAVNDWIISLDYSELKKSNSLYFKSNSKILSFNYTKTIENYIKPNSKILHIHGIAIKSQKYHWKPDERDLDLPEMEDSEIILGHSPITCSQKYIHHPDFDSYQNVLRSINFDTLLRFIDESEKNTNQIIQNNQNFFNSLNSCNEIVVYGHSLGNCDLPYFYEIIKNIPKKTVFTFYYHSNEDLNKINTFASKNLKNNLVIKKQW